MIRHLGFPNGSIPTTCDPNCYSANCDPTKIDDHHTDLSSTVGRYHHHLRRHRRHSAVEGLESAPRASHSARRDPERTAGRALKHHRSTRAAAGRSARVDHTISYTIDAPSDYSVVRTPPRSPLSSISAQERYDSLRPELDYGYSLA